MKVIVAKDYQSQCAAGADIIEEIVRNKPDCCLGLATGSTPIGYLTALRIRHAQVQLLQGASVLETATTCGFENVSFFIQKFKEATGCTPGQYRKSPHR